MKYRIKKIIYKFSKMALRVFIFFSCVVILIVPAFAQQYSSWGTFMGASGTADFYVSTVYNAQTFNQYNSATGGRTGSYGDYVDIKPYSAQISSFRSMIMRVSNAVGFTSLNNDEVLYFNSSIALSNVDSANNNFQDNLERYGKIVLSYFDSDDHVHSITTSFSGCVSNMSINRNTSTNKYHISFDLLVPVDIKNAVGDIQYLDFYFTGFSSNTVSVDIAPGYTGVLWYTGTVAGAPIYNGLDTSGSDNYSPPDDTAINDYHESESAVLGETDNDVSIMTDDGGTSSKSSKAHLADIFNPFSGNTLAYWNTRLLALCKGIGSFINQIPNLKQLFKYSLALGSFAFIFNIVPYVGRGLSSVGKRRAYNDFVKRAGSEVSSSNDMQMKWDW